VDLFEPGSGSQVHDFNGGILASGLFWTLPVDRGDLRVSRDGRTAVLAARNLPLIDSFQFFGPNQTPASVSFRVEWRATGEFAARGSGTGVPATDAASFLGQFAQATSTATFEGSELGFSFRSDPGVSTTGGYAQLGRERNGVHL
jgi:hypothetical protein